MKGHVFDIQTFSLHDGPGIRTTVFLKGCPLRCNWCSNPEGFDTKSTLSYQKKSCSNCLNCVEVCSTDALISVEGQLLVQHDKCNACGDCIDVCPTGSLKLYGYLSTPEEIVNRIIKDKSYFERSGGGITLSGGEVMMQSQFSVDILRLAKEKEIHTCIETCGIATPDEFASILPYTDLILFDYKLSDPVDHRNYTGRSNETILKNLGFLSEKGASIILRVPIIPGINDTEEHFITISKISNEYDEIERVEVLPYHSWGEHKYQDIGLDPPDIKIKTVSPEMADSWVSRLKYLGCKNVVLS